MIIFTKLFTECQLLQKWKDTLKTPFHKKGEKELASNYHPISLTCITFKVMEFIIKDRILFSMINNIILTYLQHDSVPGKSYQSNLLSMINILIDATEHNLKVDLVYLEFAKVFHLVPHRNLIHKLEKYGISGQLLLWVKNFLSNRRHEVYASFFYTRLGISYPKVSPK